MRHSAQDKAAGSSRLDQVPYWLALCGIALGLVWIRGGERDVRSGTLVIGGVLLAAAVARLGLPDRRAGMLGSRRRILDVAAFAVLGVGLLVAGLVFPVPT
ncbi:MAG TPA: DUF3017 domain-containing protein [Streptosporangiaceae bacterium]|nr:DUF3017 domain-containing protein [Streptosporangiaceae bacterium]